MTWQETAYGPSIISGWDASRSKPAGALGGNPHMYRLVWIVDGSYLLSQESGKKKVIGPGTVLFLGPGCSQSFQRGHQTRENTLIFSLVHSSEGQPQAEQLWGFSPPQILPEALAHRVQDALLPILALWWLNPLRRLRAHALLAMLLASLVEHCLADSAEIIPVQASSTPLDPRIRTVERLLVSRLNSWNTSDMAAAVGMERSAFARLYKQQRGESPGALLNRARLSYACSVLSRESVDLAYIARCVGFSNVSSFSRWFRQQQGCSPSQWQQRCRLGSQ